MISSNDLKPGLTIQQDGELYIVLDASQNKTARSAMVVKAKVRNLRSGANVELSWGGGEKIQPAQIDKKEMQYLYDADDALVFMDNETYEQIMISAEEAGESMKFVKENEEVTVSFYQGNAFAIEPPITVELVITESEPGVKGNTATGATKPAIVETGAQVMVPLFVDQGEKIKIDTRTGEYLSRAN